MEIVVSEFMDDAAVAALSQQRPTLYDPTLAERSEALASAVAEARALVVRNRTRVDASLLAAAPHLRCIGRLGVGLDNIDLGACESRGVAVYPATGANEAAVAEYVVAAALVLLRRAFGLTAEVAAGAWPRQAGIGREARGRRLGLIGLGAIARQVAVRARGLGFELRACDPLLSDDDPAWEGIERLPLMALLETSDVVSLHVPLTPATRGLIGSQALARMPRGAVLINTARGGIVDEEALARALRKGHLGGAALDVFDTEPLSAEAGRRFAGLANLILSPHVAGVTEESNVRVSRLTVENVLRHLERST